MVRKSVWTFFIVLVGVTLLFGGGLNQAYADSTVAQSVTNESVTVDYSRPSTVSAAGDAESFDSTVTVYNATGYELAAGTDYSWDANNGTVEWFNTEHTTDGEEAFISYTYHDQSESTEFGGRAMQLTGTLLVLSLLLVAAKFVFGSIWGW